MTVALDADPRARFGEAWTLLFDPPVAHRGLWTPDGAPENSLAAFQTPVRAAGRSTLRSTNLFLLRC